ncbi:MAG TPA: 3' terminal RNA ribose 2'-O-methyltransferase Hen1 [Ktedonobacteraceae bacterium]|nr:3' terminal RNA ribose 2'-O-methyltransferase Hen1 [Ktedonobacteraceae bacterium]
MLLTITTTYQPATDLGYLLHKNPARVQIFELAFGQAYVFYPEASAEICTVALLLEINPIQLIRGRHSALALEQYVNDRPYVASSLLSVAIAHVFGTALNGHSAARPELVKQVLSLQVSLPVLPCRGGLPLLKQLFEPLGYTVEATPLELDETYPEWGYSPYWSVTLSGEMRLHELLTHLYVLVPVLDDDKHYWIGDDEVEKLLRHGQGWLEQHPAREQIVYRYLKHKASLTQDAIQRLNAKDNPKADTEQVEHDAEEILQVEEPINLHTKRLDAVVAVLREHHARRVLDLGCGEGKLLKLLMQHSEFTEIVGLDVAYRALEIARRRLNLEYLPTRQKGRITLLHGSLGYRDKRLLGYDAAALVEVIEHLDPARLAAFEKTVFEFARPALVVITTPNVEYNVRFKTLPAGRLRHKDHRFEWSRAEFQHWSHELAMRFGYQVQFQSIGPEDPEVGAPSQMGIFSRS